MKRSILLTCVGAAALLLAGGAAVAQECAGDCNNSGDTVVSEIITCVNIAQGNAPVTSCEACDINGNGEVLVNELIAAVNAALCGCGGCPTPIPTTPGGPTPTPTTGPTGGFCGDGEVNVAGEICDDGNNFGGDGCAANCTNNADTDDEDHRLGTFDSTKTSATVQTEAIPIALKLTGSQTFRTGKIRDTAVFGAGGAKLFEAGEMPIVLKPEDLNFDPVKVPGLVCACVRAIAVPDLFGPGVGATGSIGCGDAGLTDVSYRNVQDHNTNPGSGENRSMGAPDDAECNDVTVLPGGTTSSACREGGTDELCSDPLLHPHPGVCNSPRMITRSGGMAPRGSAFILFNTAIGLLSDAGTCRMNGPRPDGSCPYEDYGPDCLPCTDDDIEQGDANNIPLTTGTVEAALFDANNNGSLPSGAVIIDKDQLCFGLPCKTSVTGAPFDCTELANNLTGGLSGGSLAVGFPSLDANQIGDNVTTTVFFNQ